MNRFQRRHMKGLKHGVKKLVFYHGTTAENADKIMKEGFKLGDKFNWPVKSKEGFVYLSTAYAPFYANEAFHREMEKLGDEEADKTYQKAKTGTDCALIKVEVDIADLYPEDDFVMFTRGKPKYTEEDLAKVDMEELKLWWIQSLKYMGNVAAKPEALKILGVSKFNCTDLLFRMDPTISPLNFAVMGEYYKELSDWIYEGKPIKKFKLFMEEELRKAGMLADKKLKKID